MVIGKTSRICVWLNPYFSSWSNILSSEEILTYYRGIYFVNVHSDLPILARDAILTIVPEENCPRIRVGFRLVLELVLGLGAILLGGKCRPWSNILKYFLNEQITWEKVAKHFFVSDNGYPTFSRPCMDNTINLNARFCICFFANKTFLLCFFKDTFC